MVDLEGVFIAQEVTKQLLKEGKTLKEIKALLRWYGYEV